MVKIRALVAGNGDKDDFTTAFSIIQSLRNRSLKEKYFQKPRSQV